MDKMQDSSKSRAELTEMQVKALEEEVSVNQGRENRLKEELDASLKAVWDLEYQAKEHNENVDEKEDYITFLENRYSEAISKVVLLEGQLTTANLKLQGAKGRAKMDEEKDIAIKIVVWAVKAEATRVVEEYKRSTDFEGEVSKATCDAF